MKKSLHLLICISLLILAACNTKQPETTVIHKSHDPFKFNPTDSIMIDTDSLKQAGQMIPLNTAKEWIENYQQFMSSLYKKDTTGKMVPLDDTEILNGFTYRTEDLLTALGIEKDKLPSNVPHIRGYLGMTSPTSPFVFKLLLLAAVDASLDTKNGNASAGKDAYFIAKKNGVLKDKDENGGFVLDLNYPCPTLCPDTNGGVRKN